MVATDTSKAGKHGQNRDRLALAAQEVLQERGYARTAMRDIATKARVPLGTLHYYFSGKSELLIHSFRMQQSNFIASIRSAIAESSDQSDLVERVAAVWMRELATDAPKYRLWYDLRNQALFDAELQPAVKSMEALLGEVIVELAAIVTGRSPDTVRPEVMDFILPQLGGLFFHHVQTIAFGTRPEPEAIRLSFLRALKLLLTDEERPD